MLSPRIAHEQNSSFLSAYGDTVAWSHFDPRAKTYSLRFSVGGSVRRPHLAARRVPFDVDVGPGPDGRTVAVYSRCVKEPPYDSRNNGVSLNRDGYSEGRGCRAYLYDVTRQRERRLKIAGTRGSSVVFPSVWRNNIAYAKLDDRTGATRRPAQIVLRTRRGKRESVSVSRGATGDTGVAGPTGVDLRGDRVTFTWRLRRTRCRAADDPNSREASVFGFEQVELWVNDGKTSKATLVERGCSGGETNDEASNLFDAVFDVRGQVRYVLRSAIPGGRTRIRRWNAVTGRYAEEPPAHDLTSAAVDAVTGQTYIFEVIVRPNGGTDGVDLIRLPAVHFAPATRALERPLP